jgi:hypothetical protein
MLVRILACWVIGSALAAFGFPFNMLLMGLYVRVRNETFGNEKSDPGYFRIAAEMGAIVTLPIYLYLADFNNW